MNCVVVRPVTNITLPTTAGWHRFATAFGIALFALLVVVVAAVALAAPDPGWDMLAYIAASYEWSGMSPQAAHGAAYETLRQALTTGDYDALADGDAYRIAQSESWQAFASVQPFYTAKVAYIAALSILGQMTSVYTAAWILNSAALIGLAAVLMIWLTTQRLWIAAPIVVAALLSLGIANAARSPMPDPVAGVFILAGGLAFIREKVTLAFALFAAAFAFRPDTLVLFIAMAVVCVSLRQKWKTALGVLIAGLLASALIGSATSHPGWWPHFYFSAVTIQPTMEGFDPPFSLFALAKGYARGLVGSVTHFFWLPVLLATGFCAVAAFVNGRKLPERETAMLAAMVLTVVGKFVLFPLPDTRVYLPFVLVIVLLTLQQLGPVFSKPQLFSEAGGAA